MIYVSLAGVIIITSFFVYFCVRYNPQLIKGNQRVIIVKNKKGSEIMLPQQYDKPPYIAPSHLSLSNITSGATSGYLTPNYHRYARVRYRSPILRTVSEASIYGRSNGSSMGYNDVDLFSRRNTLTAGSQHYNVPKDYGESYEIEGFYEHPPPLPPPNGNRRRRMTKIQENIYSIA